MPNAPDPNTVATSFTSPRPLFAALQSKAKMEMTNQSDIVRRALMNYLPRDMADAVREEIAAYQQKPKLSPRVSADLKFAAKLAASKASGRDEPRKPKP